jgi:hypothetical protein
MFQIPLLSVITGRFYSPPARRLQRREVILFAQ